MNIEGLYYECPVNWEEIFKRWQESEGVMVEWQKIAQQKGWQTWEEWRGSWVKNFEAQNREWFRYVILDPVQTVPHFQIVPSPAWQINFSKDERNKHTFAELFEKVTFQYDKVRGILNNFPEPTEFIGICLPNKKIVLVEGHHRASALTLAKKEGRKINFNKLPTIALTFFKEGEEKIIDSLLARGTTKEPSK